MLDKKKGPPRVVMQLMQELGLELQHPGTLRIRTLWHGNSRCRKINSSRNRNSACNKKDGEASEEKYTSGGATARKQKVKKQKRPPPQGRVQALTPQEKAKQLKRQ